MAEWWHGFFDEAYARIWSGLVTEAQTAEQGDAIWKLLGLREGSRVLDAPCGYGRLSKHLAERGAEVVGVDQSEELLSHAERRRGELPPSRLRYRRHDLRTPLDEHDFDAAFNVFSSIGYGSEEDDAAILSNLREAVKPGGLVLLDTVHRDLVAASHSRGYRPGSRLADGTLVVEEGSFDVFSGRVNSRWYWHGPSGSGEKAASIRIYTATELVQLGERAGLRLRSAHRGCSTEPFRGEGAEMGGRLGLLFERA